MMFDVKTTSSFDAVARFFFQRSFGVRKRLSTLSFVLFGLAKVGARKHAAGKL